MLLQTGERIPVAIKTCKDPSADVKEKFLSEAGEFLRGTRRVNVRKSAPSTSIVSHVRSKKSTLVEAPKGGKFISPIYRLPQSTSCCLLVVFAKGRRYDLRRSCT